MFCLFYPKTHLHFPRSCRFKNLSDSQSAMASTVVPLAHQACEPNFESEGNNFNFNKIHFCPQPFFVIKTTKPLLGADFVVQHYLKRHIYLALASQHLLKVKHKHSWQNENTLLSRYLTSIKGPHCPNINIGIINKLIIFTRYLHRLEAALTNYPPSNHFMRLLAA